MEVNGVQGEELLPDDLHSVGQKLVIGRCAVIYREPGGNEL